MKSNDQPIPSTSRNHRPARTAGLALVLGLAPLVLASCDEPGASQDTAELEARLDVLESKEEIRSVILTFAQIVDDADPSALPGLRPRLHDSFVMDVVDFDGGEYRFVGAEGLIEDYGPIMAAARANLAVSAIAVDLDDDHATARFDFVNSVTPPPELGLDVDEKVLLMADGTATFVREDGAWMLTSLELVHSLAYPGTLEAIGD